MTAPGVFYPPDAGTAEDRLVYYANQFPIVEVDATYYALPARRTGELWLERTPPDFTFDIKAHALMTGQPSEVKRLPKDLREALPAELLDKKRVYARDLPNEIEDEIWARFMDGIEPLRSSGKLGAVFLQYPRWFFPSNESRDEIVKARERLGDTPFAVELRHASWFNEKNADRTIRFLEKYEIPFVMVDAPPGTQVVGAADDARHLAEAGGRPLPRPPHRDVGEVGHPGRRALPLPLRRGRARRVGAPHPRGGRAGARDPRPDEQLLRELRDDERTRDRRPPGLRGSATRPLSGYPSRVGSPRRAIPILLVAAIGACTFPDFETPSASPAPSPTPTIVAPTVAPTPTSSASSTPDPASIPSFGAGELIVTAIDGLRVRQRPGLSGIVVTGLLPRSAGLQVVMGPIQAEGLGWYLVTDADENEPQFDEGWIAAGFEPEAFLTGSGEVTAGSPYLASFAQTSDAEYGPVEIGDGRPRHPLGGDGPRWRRLSLCRLAGGRQRRRGARHPVNGGQRRPRARHASARILRRTRRPRTDLRDGRIRLCLDPRHPARP